jgi:hypothetical protein
MAAQAKFDSLYISSSEIMKRLKCGRVTLFTLKHKGKLPDAISLNGVTTLWERGPVEPFLKLIEAERAQH